MMSQIPLIKVLLILASSACLMIVEISGELSHYGSSSSSPSSSMHSLNDFSSFQSGVLGSGSGNLLMAPYLKSLHSQPNETSNCEEIWCEAPIDIDQKFGGYHLHDDYGDDLFGDDSLFDDDMNESTRGFWLEAPPDDILYMPPPPMPPAMQAYLMNMENESMKEFIIMDNGEDNGVRCNFCKLFADPKLYNDDEIYSAASKDNEAFVSSFYLLIFSIIFLSIFVVFFLIKYKKWKIFPVSESCPILSTGLLGHHKSSSSSTNHPPSDVHLSPVVNEKSPQSIIMDAPLASLGKKSTISTTGKYWRRMPNNVSGNILCMEDRRGLQSLGGSSTCISDHPYSDAASCTSSPVYAELDPSVAGSCHTPPIIGHGNSFSPYIFSSSTYSEVPENVRGHHHPSSILTDSSTYDNAAYLSAASQPFLAGHNPYTGRSLRRLAAQRSAVLNATGNGASAGQNLGQVSTPLLAGHPYHYQPNSMHLHNQHQQPGGQFHFLTGGRPLKKPRPTHSTPQTNVGVGFRIGSNFHNTMARTPAMNHYVTQGESPITANQNQNNINNHNEMIDDQSIQFSSFLENNPTSHPHSMSHLHRKPGPPSSSSSSQYTEMPLLNASPFASTYRMSETHSNNDLNSAASSTSGSGGSTNSSSATSSASLKRPLPPVPGGVRL